MPVICKVFRQVHAGPQPRHRAADRARRGRFPARAAGHRLDRGPVARSRRPAPVRRADRSPSRRSSCPGSRTRGAWRCAPRHPARTSPTARTRSASRPPRCTSSLAGLFPTHETTRRRPRRDAAHWRRRLTTAIAEVPAAGRRAKQAIEAVYGRAAEERVARAAAHPRRLPPRSGDPRARPGLGAAGLRGRADAADGRARATRPRPARRRRHAALLRLRRRLHPPRSARPLPGVGARVGAHRAAQLPGGLRRGIRRRPGGDAAPARRARARQGGLRGDLRVAQPPDVDPDPAARDLAAHRPGTEPRLGVVELGLVRLRAPRRSSSSRARSCHASHSAISRSIAAWNFAVAAPGDVSPK